MPAPYTQDKIDNWVSDFAITDEMRSFSPETQDIATAILTRFFSAACDARDVEPEDVEELDLKSALFEHIAKLDLPATVRHETPELIATFLTYLQSAGRLSGGRTLGAFVHALTPAFVQAATGKQKPITRPGAKIGRNDPCPCGSGKKYKKCCQRDE